MLRKKNGAKSDLLGIVGGWSDDEDAEWVLETLRIWNAGRSAGILKPGMRTRIQEGMVHVFEPMTPEKLPQDLARDGSGLTFELLEHGGEA